MSSVPYQIEYGYQHHKDQNRKAIRACEMDDAIGLSFGRRRVEVILPTTYSGSKYTFLKPSCLNVFIGSGAADQTPTLNYYAIELDRTGFQNAKIPEIGFAKLSAPLVIYCSPAEGRISALFRIAN